MSIGRLFRVFLLASAVLLFSQAQEQHEVKLPSGKSQRDEILKADYTKSLRDARELARLAGELKEELEKSDYHVLSVSSLKRTEEIERLARRIKSRLRRF